MEKSGTSLQASDIWEVTHVLFIRVIVAQSCLTLCNPMGYSLPGSSVHGILQARLLEWVAISFFSSMTVFLHEHLERTLAQDTYLKFIVSMTL